MKHAKRFLAALLAGVLALAAFTGCSGLLNFATVQVNTEEAQALMKQVSPALQYDTQLEYAAERIAQWMTEEVTNLTTADGQLVRKVQLDPGTGNMNPGISVNEFISDSTNGSLYLSSNVKIALTMDNSGNPYYDPGRLYAPAAQDAVEALRSEAEGCSRMGAVFIEYSGGDLCGGAVPVTKTKAQLPSDARRREGVFLCAESGQNGRNSTTYA